MTAALVSQDLNTKPLDLMKGEQNTPEFLAINPQHCVPTVVDGEVKLWESRAIMRYIVSKKAGADSDLYPVNDLPLRAKIDQLLDYDIGTLYARFGKWFYAIAFHGVAADSEESKKSLAAVHETLALMNASFIEGKFMTGDKLTIADVSCAASLTMFQVAKIDLAKYEKVSAFMKNVEAAVPNWEGINAKPMADFGAMVEGKL
jgi:glutathione S-transferase